MTEWVDLTEKRSIHEALKQTLMSHGRCLTDCPCWHDDLHGVLHLKQRLAHMLRLAERLEETLVDIREIEMAVMSR